MRADGGRGVQCEGIHTRANALPPPAQGASILGPGPRPSVPRLLLSVAAPAQALSLPSPAQSAVGNAPKQVGAHAQLGTPPGCGPRPPQHGRGKDLAPGPQCRVPGAQVCPGPCAELNLESGTCSCPAPHPQTWPCIHYLSRD